MLFEKGGVGGGGGCSLKIAVPQFPKYKEILLINLANPKIFIVLYWLVTKTSLQIVLL